MADGRTSEYLAECFWPGVQEPDLRTLDERIRAAIAELGPDREQVRYLGSILMREDEVVLCQFEGTAEAVREIAERAPIPFARILEADRSPWTAADSE